jgi:hypothetical protein
MYAIMEDTTQRANPKHTIRSKVLRIVHEDGRVACLDTGRIQTLPPPRTMEEPNDDDDQRFESDLLDWIQAHMRFDFFRTSRRFVAA